jgi:hypothetical protein
MVRTGRFFCETNPVFSGKNSVFSRENSVFSGEESSFLARKTQFSHAKDQFSRSRTAGKRLAFYGLECAPRRHLPDSVWAPYTTAQPLRLRAARLWGPWVGADRDAVAATLARAMDQKDR